MIFFLVNSWMKIANFGMKWNSITFESLMYSFWGWRMVFINVVDTLFELINGFVQVWCIQPVLEKIHFDVQLIFFTGQNKLRGHKSHRWSGLDRGEHPDLYLDDQVEYHEVFCWYSSSHKKMEVENGSIRDDRFLYNRFSRKGHFAQKTMIMGPVSGYPVCWVHNMGDSWLGVSAKHRGENWWISRVFLGVKLRFMGLQCHPPPLQELLLHPIIEHIYILHIEYICQIVCILYIIHVYTHILPQLGTHIKAIYLSL